MTKIVNNPQAMTLLGERTPRAVIYKSEVHKLHQAFMVKAGEKIAQGMPVAITEEGLIEPFIPGGTGSQVYIGIAITDNVNPAYQPQKDFPVEVTVALSAHSIVNWVTSGGLDCGPVQPSGNLLNDRFVIAETDVNEQNFISITPASDANDVIQVLIK